MSTNSCACSASTDKFVYSFGGGSADGNGSMKNLLGGKGANLAEMARIGLPVPPGFTITTEVCTYYYDHGCTYPAQLDAQVKEGIARMEQILGASSAIRKLCPCWWPCVPAPVNPCPA